MKTITVKTVYDWLNGLAPFETAESFDNVGLLMGDMNAPVKTVLFGMDVTLEMISQAAAMGAALIVTHHPLIFHPLRSIDYASPQGQAIASLAGERISLIAAHTNLDKAEGGVSDALADALCLKNVRRCDDFLRLGELETPMDENAFKLFIAKRLNRPPTLYGHSSLPIRTVAVAGGAYGEAAASAALQGAQAFVVGEIRHHEVLDACARGLLVFDAGHYATEAPGVSALYQRFLKDAAAASWPVQARLDDNAPYPGAAL